MTQSNKELILRELCARLPYGIVINVGDKDLKLDKKHQGIGVLYPEDCSDEFNERHNNASFYIVISGCYYGETIKPYLRPMSSMTDEEKEEFEELFIGYSISRDRNCVYHAKRGDLSLEIIDWLNAHHFDYRGLIPMDLALEASKGMYNV